MTEKNFEKKQELFEAALKEFTQKSFEEASLNNIIRNAGMSKGSFYYHFKNKKELYLFILEEVQGAKLNFIKDKMKSMKEHNIENDFFEILRIQGRAGIEFADVHPEYYKLWERVTKENIEIKDLIRNSFDHFVDDYINELICRAMERGELRDDLSVEFINKLIKNLFFNFSFTFIEDVEELDLEKVIKIYYDYVDFIKNGLGKRK